MDFSGRIVLSFLEEDNIQRAYFRIRPLLMQEGALQQQDIDALPDDGYLRIVPDKNEQHTFKERMRELGALCVLDLLNIPPEAVKIRNNKNYSPQRGENNQFIVYSDAVQAVPQNMVFEVIAAEPGEKEKISKASTALCYVRSGGKIFGPVSRATGIEQEGAEHLPPDSAGIHAVKMPDGTEKLFYWPQPAAQAAKEPAENAAEKDTPAVNEAPEKLNGVPLYHSVARKPVSQRAHNALMDVVDQQMRAGKIEAPGAVLNAGVAPRQVENPMEAFKRALGSLWPVQEMQRQVVSHLLSMTGVQHILNQQLAGRGVDAVTGAMNAQIQELEAERLSLIMQLDKARKNLSSLKQEALEQLTREEEERLQRIRADIENARSDVERINASRAQLLAERDELVAEMKACGDVLQLAPGIGGRADMNALCERVQKCFAAQDLSCTWDDAVHLLTLWCVADSQLEIAADSPCDALAAAQALVHALGADCAYDENGFTPVHVQAGGDACTAVLTHFARVPKENYKRIVVDNGMDQEKQHIYAVAPWPVFRAEALETAAEHPMPTCTPVTAQALHEAVFRDKIEPPKAAVKLIDDLDKALKDVHAPLPRSVRRMIYQYLSAAAVYMEGGAAMAIDRAVCAFVLPHAAMKNVPQDAMKPLLGGLAASCALLGRLLK